jgi:methyltransferase (TIGR00027 family)
MTALGVAWVRSLESERPDRLFDDPLAARFVAASGWKPPVLGDVDGATNDTARTLLVLAQSVIVRTKFLDDLLASAWAERGAGQVVILGAGLDTRPFRLPWPTGSRCFEVDLPPVLAFKAEVLDKAAAIAGCDRVAVPADLLADDWPTLLLGAGFRPERPTVWIAEGLLIYFSQEENDRLLTQVSSLSGPGHRLAITSSRPDRPLRPAGSADTSGATGTTLLHDPDAVISLWRWNGPDDPAAWLAGHGWNAHVFDREERAAAYGRPLPEALNGSAATRTALIDARRR